MLRARPRQIRAHPRALVLLALCLLCVGCGRPLTQPERAFLSQIHGHSLDPNRMRLINGAPVAAVTFKRNARPRLTCRERILPPITDAVVTAKPAAVALFNRVYLARDWYTDDFTPDFPNKIPLADAMLLAHEATHVWQWQNRKTTGYHPLRAAAEHSNSSDPYLFELDGKTRFLDYGYEQQGSIVEEYVCCRALDPQGKRTLRLQQLISKAMPVSPLPRHREHDVVLPWRNVQLHGICG